jgi:hypothetical protein
MEKRMKRVLLVSAVSAAFAFGVSAVNAQTAESEAPTIIAAAPAADSAGASRATPQRRAFRSATERVEARLAYIRTALKITDAQQSQWDSFANVLRKHASVMDERMTQRRAAMAERIKQRQAAGAQHGGPRAEHRNVSAIDRLERTQQRMAARSARLNEVIAAAKPLYASFTPEQKQVADEMLARQGRGGHHQRHHRGGHHRGA